MNFRAPYDRRMSRNQKLNALGLSFGLGDFVVDQAAFDSQALNTKDANGSDVNLVTLGQTFSSIIPDRVWGDFVYGLAGGLDMTGLAPNAEALKRSIEAVWSSIDLRLAANIQSAWADANSSSNPAVNQIASDTQSELQNAGQAADAVYHQEPAYAARLQDVLQAFADFLTKYVDTLGSGAVVKYPLHTGSVGGNIDAAFSRAAATVSAAKTQGGPTIGTSPQSQGSGSAAALRNLTNWQNRSGTQIVKAPGAVAVVPIASPPQSVTLTNTLVTKEALNPGSTGVVPGGAVVDSSGNPVFVDTGAGTGTDWGTIALYAAGGVVGLALLVALVRR